MIADGTRRRARRSCRQQEGAGQKGKNYGNAH
jgi:hypothetical protein